MGAGTGLPNLDDPLSSWWQNQQQQQPPAPAQGPDQQITQGTPGAGAPQGAYGAGINFQPPPQRPTSAFPQVQMNQNQYYQGNQRKQQVAANFLGGIFNAVQQKKTQNENQQYQKAYGLWQQLMGAQQALAQNPQNTQAQALIDQITSDPKNRKMIEESLGVMMPGASADQQKQTPTTQGATQAVKHFMGRIFSQFDPRTQAMKIPAGAQQPGGGAPGGGLPPSGAPAGGGQPQGQPSPQMVYAGMGGVQPQGGGMQTPQNRIISTPPFVGGGGGGGGGGTPSIGSEAAGLGGGLLSNLAQQQQQKNPPQIVQGRPGQVMNAPTVPGRPPNPTSAPTAPGPAGGSSQYSPGSYFYPAMPDQTTMTLQQEMRTLMADPKNAETIAKMQLGLLPTAEQQARIQQQAPLIAEQIKNLQSEIDERTERGRYYKTQEAEKELAPVKAYYTALDNQNRINATRVKNGLAPISKVFPEAFGLDPQTLQPVGGPVTSTVPSQSTETAPSAQPSAQPAQPAPATTTGGGAAAPRAPSAATPSPRRAQATAPTARTATTTTTVTTPGDKSAVPPHVMSGVRTDTRGGEPGFMPGYREGESRTVLQNAPPAPPGWSAVVETAGTGKNKTSYVNYQPNPGTPPYQFLHRNELKPIPGDPSNRTYGMLPADYFRARTVESAAEYKTDPTKLFSSFSGGREAYTRDILSYKPNWDISKYGQRYATRKSFSPGGVDNKIDGSLDTIAGHVQNLWTNFAKFGNTGNAAANWAVHHTTNFQRAGYEGAWQIDADAVADELATALKGTATDVTIQNLKATIKNPYADPAEYKRTIDSMLALVDKRYLAQDNKYVQSMGEQRDFSIMSPSSVQSLKALGFKGEMINDVGRPTTQQQQQQDRQLEAPPTQSQQTLYQTSKKDPTKYRFSTDGGKTWQMGQAQQQRQQ